MHPRMECDFRTCQTAAIFFFFFILHTSGIFCKIESDSIILNGKKSVTMQPCWIAASISQNIRVEDLVGRTLDIVWIDTLLYIVSSA